MTGLYPIIRRVRRPLIAAADVKTAATAPLVEEEKKASDAETGSQAHKKKNATAAQQSKVVSV